MPKHSKKSVRRKLDSKQKRLLKARLIRISMVIDDYVYKNKAISTTDAKAYVEEVSNYKLQCKEDVRSLQVIEKITRCMNAVIEENQDETCDTINFQTTSENFCPSPVYSLPEEDKIMLSQASTNLNANIEESERNTLNDFDTIDLCSDEDVNVQRDMQVEVEIHRAMSTLSIKEDEPIKDFNIIDCTENILKDFSENREEEIRETSAQAEILKPKSVETQNLLASVVNNDCSQSLLKDFNPKATTNRSQPEVNDEASNKLKETTSENVFPENKNTVKKKSDLKIVRFSNCNNTDTIDTDNKKKCRQKRKKVTKVDGSQVKKNSTGNQHKGGRKKKTNQNKTLSQDPIKIPVLTTDINKRTEDSFISITNDIHTTLASDKMNTSSNETVHQKTQSTNICVLNNVNNSIYNKSMGKIYNTSIENDLSWVENIRFVREISIDEFDPKYASLTDIFWENFALPYDWNDKDFDYAT